ncbi:MAG TPA: DUF4410 domain-containing protein [Burkholderiaceae bacterium]|nr:DUF4410 domain-containing protein [Burkholderiaceae bacterium]
MMRSLLAACRLASAALVLVLSACASQVTRPPEPAGAQREPVRALSSYTVTMSAQANTQLTDNLKFNIDTLRAKVGQALESKGLVAKDGDFAMQVVIDDIRVRGTFSAVMFGFMAGDDHIYGTATLSRDGKTLGSFGIKTSWALGGLAGGQDDARMGWLYEEFSKQLAEELVARRDAKR